MYRRGICGLHNRRHKYSPVAVPQHLEALHRSQASVTCLTADYSIILPGALSDLLSRQPPQHTYPLTGCPVGLSLYWTLLLLPILASLPAQGALYA